MKKIYLLASLYMLSMSACNKNTDPEANVQINGLYDVSMTPVQTATLPLQIMKVNGVQDKITLSAEGLPDGVTATFTPEGGIPEFSATLMLETKRQVAYGTYPFKVVATTPLGDHKKYDLNLKVNYAPDCSRLLAGTYAVTETGNNPGSYSSTITVLNDTTIRDSKYSRKMILDCQNSRIIVPAQAYTSYGSGNISGTGMFNGDSISIDYTYKVTNLASEQVKTMHQVYIMK